MSKDLWNERYATHPTVYGVYPNNFFKDQLDHLKPGKLLLPAEGEGRNAVYAAKQGWEVEAFDYSETAAAKGLAFAKNNHVTIQYTTGVIGEIQLPSNTYDAIALIYVHLPETIRHDFHQQCMVALKPGGIIIIEAFCKEQINNQSGGPKDINLLYALSDILTDFDGMENLIAKKDGIFLEEGNFHVGLADVLRLVLKKKN
jgi:SAM-dependent methyltransferase